jgi:hypothetical protein
VFGELAVGVRHELFEPSLSEPHDSPRVT